MCEFHLKITKEHHQILVTVGCGLIKLKRVYENGSWEDVLGAVGIFIRLC